RLARGWPMQKTLVVCIASADASLDHQIVGAADHQKMLYPVPAHQHQSPCLVDLAIFADRQAGAAAAADIATERSEGDKHDEERADNRKCGGHNVPVEIGGQRVHAYAP